MLNKLFLNFGFVKSMFNFIFFSENLGRSRAIRAPETNKIKNYNTCILVIPVCVYVKKLVIIRSSKNLSYELCTMRICIGIKRAWNIH